MALTAFCVVIIFFWLVIASSMLLICMLSVAIPEGCTMLFSINNCFFYLIQFCVLLIASKLLILC